MLTKTLIFSPLSEYTGRQLNITIKNNADKITLCVMFVSPRLFGIIIALTLADKMHLMAVAALLDTMIIRKVIPMVSLILRQDTGAAAERADRIERMHHRRPDKLGPIGNSLHGV